MTGTLFHPAVDAWFRRAFEAPTEAQQKAWPAIRAGRDVLVAAPTGSGKTLAAFMAAIDDLIRRGVQGSLPDETTVVYVSPLKALSNDVRRNLELPLAGIRATLKEQGCADVNIRTLVRTGDTPQAQRQSMGRQPPHIVITTPESLYVMLGSDSGRRVLATTRTVIVDEIHAIVGGKRGSHLALSLERLQALSARPQVRIGLSATQKPLTDVARFLIGARRAMNQCTIVDAGYARNRDLRIEVPPSPLEAVMSGEVWQQVYDRLAELIAQHRTTLVFVNTRRHAERVARHLSERLGAEKVTAHHGSLSRERRFGAEQRLKEGNLKALVATASLELGIDIGDVNLVCQVGSCRRIATFLQRAGRAGHSLTGIPKARLFPLSIDELVECTALLDAVHRGELDRLVIPARPLDVLAQQIVAEVAAREWGEADLYELVRGAAPYRDLTREEYGCIVGMLADGYGTGRGHLRQYIHRDAVHGRLRARRGARLTAITSGGTIPDNADYDVVLEPEGGIVGTVNEDFAVESLQGDIFQLGNTSYRILRVEAGRVRVEDARGQPPSIPFWLGEAPGRSDELSYAVSRLMDEVANAADAAAVAHRLTSEVGADEAAAAQLIDYLCAAKAALGALPTLATIVLERFFDETGGTQLVIHSPYGSRINRAWGLALRKRFCRKFDFELQAAATEDCIVLSLSTSHSFPLDEVAAYLNSKNVREVLVQALLAAPMFTARWRWNAAVALAIPRFRGGRKVPPQLQRIYAEDLIADVFPDQIACAENLTGEREIPDHPLVKQTITDCLEEAMDIAGLQRLLAGIESGAIKVVARDLTEPSPLALQVLAARPYAFLDNAPLEERRTRAVMGRRWMDPRSATDLGKLDPAAVIRVCEEAFPVAETADELHDALMWCGVLTEQEVAQRGGWPELAAELAAARRAALVHAAERSFWVAAERLPRITAVFDSIRVEPPTVRAPEPYAAEAQTGAVALTEIVRGRMEGLGPVTADMLAVTLGLARSDIDVALLALEAEGFAMRGSFTTDATETEWCERRLLARIHRYTVDRLRREIEPVTTQDFMRFLLAWQHVDAGQRKEGADALAGIINDLEGFEAPAAAWETEILPARLSNYDFAWLDDLCLAGRAVWARLARPRADGLEARRAGPVRTTPIAILPRRHVAVWNAAAGTAESTQPGLTSRAQKVRDFLASHGASFFDELADATSLLGTEAEAALAELVALGLVASDSFAGLRALLVPVDRRKPLSGAHRRGRSAAFGIQDAGRWSLVREQSAEAGAVAEHVARALLRRYGMVCWRLLAREGAWLPPWRDIVRVLRRLEARGEIRGGRFVAGITGEQYALPEAVAAMRELRRREPDGNFVSVSAADPLNLVGIVTPGTKVPAYSGNRVLFRDGVPIAALVADEVIWLREMAIEEQAQARSALIVRSRLAPQLLYLR